jgi:uncharacterized NAD-dependent epimerase/dehydratase family protein
MIEGDGLPIDCVVADFVSGAAEKLVLANQHHDILLIEGQGSLLHPSYSGVTLSLLHGSQPDGLILCYEAGRPHIWHFENKPFPPLWHVRDIYETMANLQHPCKVIGIGVNTRQLGPDEAAAEVERASRELGLPAADVIRQSAQPLAAAVLRRKAEVGK